MEMHSSLSLETVRRCNRIDMTMTIQFISSSSSEEFYILLKVSIILCTISVFILLNLLEYDLETYFKNIAELVDVAVMRDKNSGRSRGFAFVTFIVYPS